MEYTYSAAVSADLDNPKSYKVAMAGPQRAQWEAACCNKISVHLRNGTWKLVPLPPGAKPVGSCWVFHIKRTEDGSVKRFKARLVAKGFSQRPSWDFMESFAPTIRLLVVRAIFALVAAEDLDCESIDITTVLLNGDLDETIYMLPPEGFEELDAQGRMLYCLLLKVLYGLKQGVRHLKLSEVMKKLGFRKVCSKPCMYMCGRTLQVRVSLSPPMWTTATLPVRQS